jgi:hypothetical protein
MYFPYFRGRRHELLAIRKTIALASVRQNVIPIVEPVSTNTDSLVSAVKEVRNEGGKVVVVTNPCANTTDNIGNVLASATFERGLAEDAAVVPAFIVLSSSTPASVETFFRTHDYRDIAIIHCEIPSNERTVERLVSLSGARRGSLLTVLGDKTSAAYRESMQGATRVVIRDGFIRKDKNASYIADEFFTDLHQTYSASGFHGYGDYSIVGDFFSERGGPAYAVAIHLMYLAKNGELWLHHLVSDTNSTAVDPGGKFLEAVRKLPAFLRRQPSLPRTDAINALLDLARRRHYPGLGPLKELAIRHHIELAAQL